MCACVSVWVYVHVCVCVCASVCMCKSETTCRNWFFSSTMWILGSWTRAWEQAPLPAGPSRWPHSFLSAFLVVMGYGCTPNTHQRLFVCGFPIQNSEAVEASEMDYLQFLSLPWGEGYSCCTCIQKRPAQLYWATLMKASPCFCGREMGTIKP